MVRAMVLLFGVGAVLGSSCSFSRDGLDVESGETATTPPPAMKAGAMPSSSGESTPAQPATAVMRVHDVKAKHLSVGVLFANELEAKDGSVATSGPPLPAADLAAQLGEQDIEAPELVVDVLYANHVKARFASIREVHAIDVKIGDKGNPED